MKKKIVILLIMTLLFGVVFSTSAQAVELKYVAYYVKQNGTPWSAGDGMVHPGSFRYWQIRTVEEQSWTGENRPEPLMGDANIDGKVDARDALMALYFGLYGDVQSIQIVNGVRTPEIFMWRTSFAFSYNNGLLEEQAQKTATWFDYCRYNSPFFADVTKDCCVNALDALEILKYSVGKAEEFPVGDFTTYSERFHYYPWPTEYYPGMLDGDLIRKITNEEYCEKFNLPFFNETVTETDK